MQKLEQIAQQMFIDFCLKKTGVWLDWRYLSPARKLDWMKDVALTFQASLSEIQKELMATAVPNHGAASYEKGFNAGRKHEISRLVSKIELMQDLIDEQLEDFKEKHATSQNSP